MEAGKASTTAQKMEVVYFFGSDCCFLEGDGPLNEDMCVHWCRKIVGVQSFFNAWLPVSSKTNIIDCSFLAAGAQFEFSNEPGLAQ